MNKLWHVGVAFALLLSGCETAPTIAVFGAAFPDWLFCIAGAILATMVVHVILSRRRLVAWLAPVGLSYPLMATMFALLFWLIFFLR
jgi:hypothetical protein